VNCSTRAAIDPSGGGRRGVVRPRSPDVAIVEWAGQAPTDQTCTMGSYRVRYAPVAWRSGATWTSSSRRAVDAYRLTFWPAPAAPDAVLRQTSDIAAYWHSELHGTLNFLRCILVVDLPRHAGESSHTKITVDEGWSAVHARRGDPTAAIGVPYGDIGVSRYGRHPDSCIPTDLACVPCAIPSAQGVMTVTDAQRCRPADRLLPAAVLLRHAARGNRLASLDLPLPHAASCATPADAWLSTLIPSDNYSTVRRTW
jgi:hypothetical protein